MFVLAAVIVASLSASSFAHHPGKKLDALMGSKEKYFQIVDRQSPSFTLKDADGRRVRLTDFRDKVVVLHFVYAACPDVCPLHAERLAQVQEMIAATPMKNRVQFVTITTDPKNDTTEVMRAYGPTHGLKAENWVFLTTASDQPEDATRQLAKRFGHSFTKTYEGYQAHGIVTHVIDRGGRWAANFHGLRFEAVNLVLYINGLTNNQPAPATRDTPGVWDRLKGLF